MNYLNAILASAQNLTLEVRDIHGNGRIDVRCPCGAWVHPAVVLDVSALPDALTNGEEWACDNCWNGWKRERRDIDAGDNFIVPEEFLAKMLERIGCPQSDVQYYRGNALRALAKRRADCAPDDPLIAEIDARAGIVPQVSTQTIAANGSDAATVSGIPAGALAALDGGTPQPVTDGEVRITATVPGAYRLTLTHPEKLSFEVTINAN